MTDCETVGCLSVRPSVYTVDRQQQQQPAGYCGQEISIDCGGRQRRVPSTVAGAQQQRRRSTALTAANAGSVTLTAEVRD